MNLNKDPNQRYRYYFDEQKLHRVLPKQLSRKQVFVLFVMVLLSLSWVPLETYFKDQSFEKFQDHKVALNQQVNARQNEVRYIKRVVSSFETGLTDRTERQLSALIYDLAEHYHLDPYLILALIRVESYFYNPAVSIAGAEGLMQVLPMVGEEVAQKINMPFQESRTLFKPLANVQIGTYYLAYLLDRFEGNLELALLGYNRGPNGVSRALFHGRHVPRHYAENVIYQYHRFLERRNQYFQQPRLPFEPLRRKPVPAVFASIRQN